MKVSELIGQVLDAAQIENKASFIEAMSKLQDAELGETFDGLRPALKRLVDATVAHQIPEIADRVRGSVVDEIQNQQIAELAAAGFTEAEIAELKGLSTGKIKKALEKQELRLKEKYGATATEREAKAEAELKQMREALEREKMEGRLKIESFQKDQQRLAKEAAFRNYIAALPLDESMLTPELRIHAASMAVQSEIDKLNGELVYVNGQLVLRKAGDPALSVTDGVRPLTLDEVSRRALASQNLLKKEKNPAKTPLPTPAPAPNFGGSPPDANRAKISQQNQFLRALAR